MTLSQQTIDHLNDAAGNLRAALRSAAVNEKPLVVHQISKLLMDIEQCKEFDHIMDLMEEKLHGNQ